MANTQAGLRVFICVTPKPTNLTQEQYEALVWVEVGKVGSVGESGPSTNIVNYDELSTDVTQKQKGITDAQNTPIEVARDLSDAGQQALRAAALTRFNYAMKFEDPDKPSADYTNSITYRRGIITGPTRAGGRNEDFITDVFTLGQNQREVIVAPEAQVAVVNVLRPGMLGAAVQTGVQLTAYEGTWQNEPTGFTYQWQADDAGNGAFVSIGGATSRTFTPVVGNVGDSIRVGVTAVNGEGTPVTAYSMGVVQIAA